jgi:hypothetical protein
MIADVPIGLTLSGGLFVCVLPAWRGCDILGYRTFTIGFGLADDETPFARRWLSMPVRGITSGRSAGPDIG